MKAVVAGDDDRILGFTMIGAQADEDGRLRLERQGQPHLRSGMVCELRKHVAILEREIKTADI